MASRGDQTKRRSSLFFGSSFLLNSSKTSSKTPSEQSSYSDLKHGLRLNSLVKEEDISKVTVNEPLFHDSYISSEDEAGSSSAGFQEPPSPTFSEELDFDDDGEDTFDEVNIKDSMTNFGLGLAIETYKPSDVARKVSIVVCKPKQVYITPPTSPAHPRSATAMSTHRHSFVPSESSRPVSMTQAGSYFNSYWSTFHQLQNVDSASSRQSSSAYSNRSSSSSFSEASEASRSTAATSVTSEYRYPADKTPLPPQPIQRTNAVKRQSRRLSGSFSRSFLAKAADGATEAQVTRKSAVSPVETIRPATSMGMRPITPALPNDFVRPSAPANSRSSSPVPMRRKSIVPSMSKLQINVPDVSTMPPPPESYRPRNPALRKKKSISDIWFRRSVSTYI